MYKFLRWYYKNKNKFWVIVLIILGSYGLLLWLNNLSKENLSINNNKANIVYANKSSIKSEKSILTDKFVETEDLQIANKVIDKFITLCNNGDIEGAYNLISSKCKQTTFPEIYHFKENYYNKVFNTQKIYEMINWENNTYQIKLKDDPMVTGILTDEFIQSFYIIVEEDGKTLITISGQE